MINRSRLRLPVAASVVVVGAAAMVAAGPSSDLLKEGKFSEAYEQTVQGAEENKRAFDDLARDVLEVAFESPDPFQRWHALRASRFSPDPELIPSLRRIAREADRYEQSLALDGLLAAKPRDAREELTQSVASSYRPVRVRGLRGLVEQSDSALVATFAGVLANDDDPHLRALAARGLGRSKAAEALVPLRTALDDPSEVVQDEVTQALVLLQDDQLAGALAERLAKAGATAERVRWIRLMRYLHDEKNLPVLAQTLRDPDAQVRTYGAASLLAVRNRIELKK